MKRDGRRHIVQRRGVAERAAGLVDMRLELSAELVRVACDRDRGRLAEWAKALAVYPIADVDLVALEDDRRRAARDDRLQHAPVRDAAAEPVDELPQAGSVLDLVVPRPLDVARDRDDAGTARVGYAELRVLRAAHVDDGRQGRDRLDVVHDGRRRVESLDGGKRRLRPWLSALPLERLEQRGLLAADVRARTAVEDD